MAECLRKIAEHAARTRVVFLGEQTEIILQRERALEKHARIIETLLQDVIVRQPEAAGEESALAWRQTVDAISGGAFFAMTDLAENARRKAQGQTPGVISPLAMEAVRRIDALFEIERSINGQSAEQRRVIRQELSAPLVADLESWMREQRAKLSGGRANASWTRVFVRALIGKVLAVSRMTR